MNTGSRGVRLALALLLFIAGAALLRAQSAPSADEVAIRAVLAAQVGAWNQGDIAAFMSGYEDSPETTFVSTKSVEHGFQQILARYRRNYTNHAEMGTLSFADLAVRLLPAARGKGLIGEAPNGQAPSDQTPNGQAQNGQAQNGEVDYAVVTGRFHLDRSSRGTAAQDDGIFSLLWRKTPAGWKIILDHTA